MPAPRQPMMQNKLLALLPSIDYDQIAPDLTHVILPRGRVLAEAGGRIEYIYFLTTGIGSVVATTPEGHCADERLARWLLMCHDRLPGNEIRLTHDYLAVMLSVRRPSVTTSLHVLEGNGFIRSDRGVVIMRNRPAMEEFARDAYGRPEEEYRRLMKDLF